MLQVPQSNKLLNSFRKEHLLIYGEVWQVLQKNMCMKGVCYMWKER